MKFTKSFKIHSVEKAFSRAEDVSLKVLSDSLDVGYSTLQLWIQQYKNHELETVSAGETQIMANEKTHKIGTWKNG